MTAEPEIKKYEFTKEHCATLIHGVCDRCGGELEPIETVDNARNPTYWPHCPECKVFCYGCNPTHYEIAKRLVDECFYTGYAHMDLPKSIPLTDQEKWYKEHYRREQINSAVRVVRNVLTINEKLQTKSIT